MQPKDRVQRVTRDFIFIDRRYVVIRDVVQKRKLDIKVLGPAPCPITKLQSNYRFHFLLSAADLNAVRILWRDLRPTLPTDRSVEFVVDVDPINLR